MVSYRHWSVLLWWDPNDVPHRRILPSYEAEWWSVPALLCWWCCYCLADQLWVLIAYARRRRRMTTSTEDKNAKITTDNSQRNYAQRQWHVNWCLLSVFHRCRTNKWRHDLNMNSKSCKRSEPRRSSLRTSSLNVGASAELVTFCRTSTWVKSESIKYRFS